MLLNLTVEVISVLKKIFMATLLMLIISANCLAMTFQEPVSVGAVTFAGSENAIEIYGATKIDATTGFKENCFVKGMATFNETLYLHFDGEALMQRMMQNPSSAEMIKIYDEVSSIGSLDVANTVPFFVFEGSTKIYRLPNDAGLEIYLLATETGGGGSMRVIGNSSGNWVEYFNTNDDRKNYGFDVNFYLSNFRVEGDEIIFSYISDSEVFRELCYRWDSSAQWFSVNVR